MKEHNNFFDGIRDGIPICLGYLSVSFAFGIFSSGTLGLSVLEALLISMFNLTSAGQLAGAPIIASFGSPAELASTQLVINMRYSLMSVSLSQKLGREIKMRDRFWMAFFVTDEIFAVSSSKDGNIGRRYMLGLVITPYFGWSIGTLIGAAAGNILPQAVVSALGVAIYGMFTAIVVPACKKDRPTLLCVLLAIMLGCTFEFTPILCNVNDGFVIIICAVVSSLLFAVLAPVSDKSSDETEHGSSAHEECHNGGNGK